MLRVNSPGGEVVRVRTDPARSRAIKAAGKPVVVSMGDVAASGGYWISMNADRIFAEPSTITGSIGIFGLIPTIPRTLAKIGVHTDGVGTTRFAGAFDITRPLDPEVGAMVQTVIDKGYRDFIGRVAHGARTERRGRSTRSRAAACGAARRRRSADWSTMFGGIAGRGRRCRRARETRQARRLPGALHREAGDAVRTLLHPLRAEPRRRGPAARFEPGASRCWRTRLPQTRDDFRFLDAAMKPSRRGMPVKALAYCFCGL